MTLTRRKPLTVGLLTAMCIALLAPLRPAAAADKVSTALDAVPDDASLVIIVPNMASLNKKLADLQKTLGIPVPQLADALGSLKSEIGIDKGVNDSGGFIFILHDLSKFKEGPEAAERYYSENEPISMAFAVSDYAAFVGNFEGDAGKDVTELKMSNSPEPGYARKAGNFAVISPNKKLIDGYKAGGSGKWLKAAGSLGKSALDRNDISVIANVENMRDWLKPLVADGFKEARKEMEREMKAAGDDPMAKQVAPMAAMVFDLMAKGADAVLSDADMAIGGADISDAGFGFTYTFQFKPGSESAAYFKGGGEAAPLMKLLPKRNWLMVTAMNYKGMDLDKIQGAVTDALKDKDGGWMVDLVKATVPLMTETNSQAQAMYLPSVPGMGIMGAIGMGGGSPFPTLSVADVKDPAKYVKATQNMLDKLAAIKIEMPPHVDPTGTEKPTPPAGFETSWSPAAIDVEGATVHQFSVGMKLPPNLTRQMAANPAMAGVVGMAMQPQRGYMATSGKYVVATQSLDAELLTEGVKGLSGGKGLGGDKMIENARKQLPKNADMEMYFNLKGLAELLAVDAGMFLGMKLVVPADMQAMSFGAKMDDGAMIGRAFLPMDNVIFVKDTAMAIQAAMAGGGPGGPGGGGPPPGF